jgi:hypothetical protein
MEWKKLHNEELHDLLSSPNIIRRMKLRIMRWAGHVAHMGRGELHTEFWCGKKSLETPRRKWEDNNKMDLQEVGWGSMNWIDLAQNRDRWLRIGTGNGLENSVIILRFP